ncbi:MAG: hypothetical protein AAFO58_12575, partial [Pseudomonadota bacterium]
LRKGVRIIILKMKTIFCVMMLFAIARGLDVDFTRDFEPWESGEDTHDKIEVHSDNESKGSFDLPLKQMGIPVVFVGSSGRCSPIVYVRIGATGGEDGADSINEETVDLKYGQCDGAVVENTDKPDEEDEEKGLEEYEAVIDAEVIELSASGAENPHGLEDARKDDSKILRVNVQAPGNGGGERKNRILKLTISPDGKTVLTMNRGLTIV